MKYFVVFLLRNTPEEGMGKPAVIMYTEYMQFLGRRRQQRGGGGLETREM